MNLKDYIATFPDFPEKGILFRDITPLLKSPEAFGEAIQQMCSNIQMASEQAQIIIAPEARGFIFGVPIAYEMGLPFVPVRKPGKLPGDIVEQEYTLEYGKNKLAIPANAIKPGDRVAIIDDLLATGGTIKAICALVQKMGGKVVHISCLIELKELKGREELKGHDLSSILTF